MNQSPSAVLHDKFCAPTQHSSWKDFWSYTKSLKAQQPACKPIATGCLKCFEFIFFFVYIRYFGVNGLISLGKGPECVH